MKMNRLAFRVAAYDVLRPVRAFLWILPWVALGLMALPHSTGQVRLVVSSLGFENGRIYQHVAPRDMPAIVANWSASVWSLDGRLMCNGRGVDEYEPKIEPVRMTVDDWTGDECGLVPGERYRGEAAWSWTSLKGEARRTSSSFTFTYRPPAGD